MKKYRIYKNDEIVVAIFEENEKDAAMEKMEELTEWSKYNYDTPAEFWEECGTDSIIFRDYTLELWE